MRLYFLRHGQAGDKDTWPGDDFQRPLTAGGRAEMEAAANGLRALNLKPNVVLSSPLVRARQTAEIAAQAFGMAITEAAPLAPGCDLDGLADALRPYRQVDEVLIVGHEPDFSTLIGLLIARQGDNGDDRDEEGRLRSGGPLRQGRRRERAGGARHARMASDSKATGPNRCQ